MEASSTGTRPGRVEVEIDDVEGGWLISVSDDGPGIAPSDHERIFEIFQTVSPNGSSGSTIDDRRGRSSGLGLAIVKKIVDSRGGKIWLESTLGEGARFIVHLPDSSENFDIAT